MNNILKLQLKNSLRDKIQIVSLCLPIVIALLLKIYVPTNLIIDPKVGIIINNIEEAVINEINTLAEVEVFTSGQELRNRVLATNDELIGIIYNNNSHTYQYLLQGNESTLTYEIADIIANVIENKTLDVKMKTEILPNNDNDIRNFLIVINILISFYMGSAIITFTMVAEKEDGLTNIFDILPMTKKQYLAQKLLMGFIATMFVTFVTSFFLFDLKRILYLTPFIIVSGVSSVILGLYIGKYSKDLISAIINAKVILLVFMFVPFIGVLMPPNLKIIKSFFYILPSYPMFKGLLDLLKDGNITKLMLNTVVIVIQIMVVYFSHIFYNTIKVNE